MLQKICEKSGKMRFLGRVGPVVKVGRSMSVVGGFADSRVQVIGHRAGVDLGGRLIDGARLLTREQVANKVVGSTGLGWLNRCYVY